ncbi:MAG: transposase [Parachlamydiaceae bacterium]|nr:transposase [Parachlamydiaceae bacterium]
MPTNKIIKLSESEVNSNPKLDVKSLTFASGENLPHWQCDNAIYHISFRLADSIPQSVRERWLLEYKCLISNINQHNKELSVEIIRKAQHFYSKKIEKYLDDGYGKCYLRKTEIAEMVVTSFTHFDNVRYRLHAWCIMPNHVHIIVEGMPGNDLSKIIHSWKSYTAHNANEMLGLEGAFWQRDAYNHIIRSKKEYLFQIQYTWENPEKARLRNWKWRWKADNS